MLMYCYTDRAKAKKNALYKEKHYCFITEKNLCYLRCPLPLAPASEAYYLYSFAYRFKISSLGFSLYVSY